MYVAEENNVCIFHRYIKPGIDGFAYLSKFWQIAILYVPISKFWTYFLLSWTKLIAKFLYIVWANRFGQKMKFPNTITLRTVDGSGCCIQELKLLSPLWFSHKFKGSSFRYQIEVSLEGEGLWVNGTYKWGSYPDLKI